MTPICERQGVVSGLLLLDADEFVSTRDRAQLLAALAAIPPGGAGLLPWRTYVIAPDEQDRAEDPLQAMRWRRRSEVPQYWKAAIRLDGAYRPDLEVAQGNHLVSSVAGEVPTVPVADLAVLHFPVRSKAQIISKAVVGWTAYLARNPEAREQALGFQWREAFDRVASDDDSIDEVDLPALAMNYAQSRTAIDWPADAVEDPPPLDVRRRYSTGKFARPLALIARSWERSLAGTQSLVDLAKPTVAGDLAGVAATTFDADWHWANLFVDVPPFRFLIEKYQPGSALDIGCGIGALPAAGQGPRSPRGVRRRRHPGVVDGARCGRVSQARLVVAGALGSCLRSGPLRRGRGASPRPGRRPAHRQCRSPCARPDRLFGCRARATGQTATSTASRSAIGSESGPSVGGRRSWSTASACVAWPPWHGSAAIWSC